MLGELQTKLALYKDVVFKRCSDNILVLKRPLENFQSNEKRKDVFDPNFAKFRCNGLFVVEIIEVTNVFKNLLSINHKWNSTKIRYTVGEIVKPDYFDFDLDLVCGHGIHYFLTLEAAFYYECRFVKNGKLIHYYENGAKSIEENYKNGKLDGLCISFNTKNQIEMQRVYNNGDCIFYD